MDEFRPVRSPVSPHGGFMSPGVLISHTLRKSDILRALRNEIVRLKPFGLRVLVSEMMEVIGRLEGPVEGGDDELAQELIDHAVATIDSWAQMVGLEFGTDPNDPACLEYRIMQREDA